MSLDHMRCPACRQPLTQSSGSEKEIHCQSCGASFPIRDGIFDFIPQDDFYWGEVARDKLKTINDEAERSGDWYAVLQKNLTERPRLIKYITHPSRLGWLFHCYDPEHTDACLDIGSGWGPLSFGLSRVYKTVYSLDRVYERMRFQSIRARLDGVQNIRFLRSDFLKLPLEDHSLDLIALNGVLEWVGMSDTSLDPDELQKRFLEEVARVLKPGGKIYLGIENRLALQYFLGHKDHSGLAFTSLVPRRVADQMVRRATGGKSGSTPDKKFFHKKQVRYRTYTYSLWGYKKLLRQAGFDDVAPYWAWKSYSYPRMSGTLDAASIRYTALNLAQSTNHGWRRHAARLLLGVPGFILSFLVKLFWPDFLIVAGRKSEHQESLQDRILAGEAQNGSFVRVSPATIPALETTYLLLDRKANPFKSVSVHANKAAAGSLPPFVLAEEQALAGRLIRPSDKDDIARAAKWLGDFQSASKKGEWVDRQLEAEIRTLGKSVASLPAFENLKRPIEQFEQRYVDAVKDAGLSVVSEQGQFIPLNLVVTSADLLFPADWSFSNEQGVPLMDIGGFYLSLLRRAAEINGSSTQLQPDGPLDWFVQEMGDQVQIPVSMAPVYYLFRVINRIQEGQQAPLFTNTAYGELNSLLSLALDHSLSMDER